MKLAVVGSRTFASLEKVRARLDDFGLLHSARPNVLPSLEIVSGGAYGVDQWAEQWGHRHGFPVISFRVVQGGHMYHPSVVKPDGTQDRILGYGYSTYGQCAFARNSLIVEEADHVLAFWDGTSRGTKHSIDLALGARKPLEVVFP